MQPSPQMLEQKKGFEGVPCAGILIETLPQGLYAKHGKRVLDFVSSAAALLLLLPLFALVAVCIKLTSRGPVFYRQMRLGRDGQFPIVKFRSMDNLASEMPPGITVSGDKRITTVGRILRRYKIDELPQLWNVLRGDMSLVGPRPELPKYVEAYSPEQELVLCVRPGITDPASLAYRHEEDILSRCEDPEQVYRTQILPDKLARNLSYIRNISFWTDLHIIFATMGRSFLFVKSTPQQAESEASRKSRIEGARKQL
jgi:lipopolysaccharide/colanic/teichoic acid biosynthesis glycosyltransferase